MVKEDLIQRSPVRIFEKSIQGALNTGEIGVIAAPNGIGKTSVLVQIALDKLLQAQKVIHVSFTQHNNYVLAWYENIFDEFIQKHEAENLRDVKDELVKNRVLMHFNQSGMSGDQILNSLKAMIAEGGFKARTLIIDGFDFSRAQDGHLAKVKALARELGFSVWYSCSVPEQAGYTGKNIPHSIEAYLGLVDVVIVLEPKADYIALSVSKDRDSANPEDSMIVRLDPRTLLIRS
ncbi:MAG: hypothetical protein LBD13_02730 [Spirochaetaceae bacterium]|jgi:KaiC/GvpD/RAD55 family RecA-like ATPase|nr:hypothetical protein [Spirochaetaceae bacterium]